MVTKIKSGGLIGINGYIVDVETDVSRGMPAFEIVGLPDSAVKESRERVKAAIKNSGIEFPIKRITVNLAPADLRKEGPSFDLPIAVGILCCCEIINPVNVNDVFICGELSLDGKIRGVKGILPMVHTALKEGIKEFIIPSDNAEEAALIHDAVIYNADSIIDVVNHFNRVPIERYKSIPFNETSDDDIFALDFSDVKGQSNVKRALEITAAGYHNILMIGPPGSGKTMLAKRLPYIMPDLEFAESLEVTKVYSVSGLTGSNNSLVKKRPFRAPHHTISYAALTGGGKVPKPGEISLAHKGVLFLDELPEFNRNVLEILRQPLEDRYVTISRAMQTLTYPADFMLVAAMNPCPCGNLYSGDSCTCTNGEISKYLGKISGPLLDRIDIQVETSKINYNDIRYSKGSGEKSADIKNRVLKTQQIQKERYANEGILYNSQLSAALIEKYCPLSPECHELLKLAFDSMNLSVRAFHKILKVARTIADLEDCKDIAPPHVSEAIQYRGLDRKYWG